MHQQTNKPTNKYSKNFNFSNHDTHTHIDKTKDAIKAKLDELLREYMSADRQIESGKHNDSEFFGSMKYYELQAKKAELSKAHSKLTDALVAIEMYM